MAAAFSQRRKTLRNSLAGLLDTAQIEAAGVDPSMSPETLPPAKFAALAGQLGPTTDAPGSQNWSCRAGDL